MDLPEENDSFRYTVDALDHAITGASADVVVHIVRTDQIGRLGNGVVIGPGSPYRDAAAAEDVIQSAREKGIPLVGT
jgi:CTP synthase (UTP-ammonia lyase)